MIDEDRLIDIEMAAAVSYGWNRPDHDEETKKWGVSETEFKIAGYLKEVCSELREARVLIEQIRRIAKFGLMSSNCRTCGEIVTHIFRSKDTSDERIEGENQ